MADDEEDQSNGTDESRMEEGDAEYAFEGYKVELNERVALTPPMSVGPGR